jgi:hypothetical protein
MTRAAKPRAGAGRGHVGFTPTEPASRPIGLGAGRPLPGPLRGRAERRLLEPKDRNLLTAHSDDHFNAACEIRNFHPNL